MKDQALTIVVRVFRGGFFIRLNDHVFAVKDRERFPPLFSERNGYRSCRLIGPLKVSWE